MNEERPRERCLSRGPQCLSLRECIALILGSGPRGLGCMGVAGSFLERVAKGMSRDEEEKAYFLTLEGNFQNQFQGIKGLGVAGKAKLLATFELGRRYALYKEASKLNQLPKKRGKHYPEMAFDRVSLELRCESKEWLGFVPLYRSGKLGEFCLIERGVRSHVNFDPVELFASVLALRPLGFFMFHNHPSGDINPSQPDFELTKRVTEVSQHLGVQFLGHGIVSSTEERWVVV